MINIWLLLTQLIVSAVPTFYELYKDMTTVFSVGYGNTLGNAIFGTLTDSPLETSDSEDENISADTDKQTDDNTSTESSSN